MCLIQENSQLLAFTLAVTYYVLNIEQFARLSCNENVFDLHLIYHSIIEKKKSKITRACAKNQPNLRSDFRTHSAKCLCGVHMRH